MRKTKQKTNHHSSSFSDVCHLCHLCHTFVITCVIFGAAVGHLPVNAKVAGSSPGATFPFTERCLAQSLQSWCYISLALFSDISHIFFLSRHGDPVVSPWGSGINVVPEGSVVPLEYSDLPRGAARGSVVPCGAHPHILSAAGILLRKRPTIPRAL